MTRESNQLLTSLGRIGRSGLLVLLVAAALFACARPPRAEEQRPEEAPPTDLASALERALDECEQLDKTSTAVCRDVVQQRRAQLDLYRTVEERRWQRLGDTLRELESEIAEQEHRCAEDGGEACRKAKTARAEARRAQSDRAAREQREKRAERRSALAMAATAKSIGAGYPRHAAWLCRLHNSGEVSCAGLSAMLASLNARASGELARSIRELVQDGGEFDTLIYCGFGSWTTADLDDDALDSMVTALDVPERLKAAITDACGEAGSSGPSSPARAGSWLGGGSGFDNGVASCLAAETAANFGGTPGGGTSIVNAIIEQTRELTRTCAASPLATDGGPPDPGAGIPSGYGIPEVCNPPTVEGNTFLPEGRTTTWDNCDYPNGNGAKTRNEKAALDHPGVEERNSGGISFDDGSSLMWSENEDGSAEYEFDDGHGNTWEQTYDKDGNGEYNDSDGNHMETDKDGDLTKWNKGDDTICDNNDASKPDCTGDGATGPAVADCPADDETCGQCGTAVQTLVDSVRGCATSLGTHPSCTAYVTASACCDRPTPGRANLLIPNPNEIVCLGESEESQEARCRKLCEQAHDAGCVDSCLSRPELDITPFFTEFCMYAYSEACIGPIGSGDAGFIGMESVFMLGGDH